MGEEQVLLEEQGARVTTTKVQIDGTTYPLAGITSVRAVQEEDSQAGGIVLGAAGAASLLVACNCAFRLTDPRVTGNAFVFAVVATLGAVAVAVFLLLVAGTIFRQLGTSHIVLLGTAGGDRQALVTRDEAFAGRVRQAIEDAITRRG